MDMMGGWAVGIFQTGSGRWEVRVPFLFSPEVDASSEVIGLNSGQMFG